MNEKEMVLEKAIEKLGYNSLEDAQKADLYLQEIIPATHAATKELFPEMPFRQRKEISEAAAKEIDLSWR